MRNIHHDLAVLARDHGIHFPSTVRAFLERQQYGHDYALAMDAQPTLITATNAGVPGYLVNFLDPEQVRVSVAPMAAVNIIGEAKKGDWTTRTSQFQMVESTGEVSSYGDHNNNGQSSSNYNWVPRESYHFQTMTRWGERELDTAGEARINLASDLNIASVLTINKAANKIAFFGVSGLQNYGLLNDPSLIAPITPAATGTGSGTTWATKTGDLVYVDIVSLFTQLVTQANGLVDAKSKMVLAMSPSIATNLAKTNQYNVNVEDLLKKNFPNLRVETAVEYATTGGQLVQLIAEEIEGQKTAFVAFTEKLRAHPVITKASSWVQKKSAGSWGSIIRRPFLIAQMLGV